MSVHRDFSSVSAAVLKYGMEDKWAAVPSLTPFSSNAHNAVVVNLCASGRTRMDILMCESCLAGCALTVVSQCPSCFPLLKHVTYCSDAVCRCLCLLCLQLPAVLTQPQRKGSSSSSKAAGCGCMIKPSKVLAKVSGVAQCVFSNSSSSCCWWCCCFEPHNLVRPKLRISVTFTTCCLIQSSSNITTGSSNSSSTSSPSEWTSCVQRLHYGVHCSCDWFVSWCSFSSMLCIYHALRPAGVAERAGQGLRPRSAHRTPRQRRLGLRCCMRSVGGCCCRVVAGSGSSSSRGQRRPGSAAGHGQYPLLWRV